MRCPKVLVMMPAALTFVGKAPKSHTNSSAKRKAAGQSYPAAFQVLDQKVSLSAPCMTRGGPETNSQCVLEIGEPIIRPGCRSSWRRQHHVLSLAWPRRRPFRQRSSRSRGDLGRISTWTTPIVFGSSRCLSCWTCCAVSLQDPVLRLALRPSCPRRSPENLIADESRAQQHRQNADPEKGNDDHSQWTQHNCRTLSRWEESRSMCSPSLRRHSSKGCDR